MTRKQLIKKYKNLFWYFDNNRLDKMSNEVLVEFILNYGSWEAFKDLLNTLDTKQVAEIFHLQHAKKRTNYFPEISNYFNLYFKQHAPKHSQ